ncbi:MAG TPA: response regulator transcription factor [Blastocatellia bacterium]|nr:response regulator transcription factor [Blastocatellia bacterium]
MNVLIADDDPTSRRLLESTLSKWGHKVVSACNGDEAWHELQQSGAPRLLILDWMLSEVDGLELCRRIRSREDLRPRYVLLLTTEHAHANVAMGLEAGADDYVGKPVDSQELHSRLGVGIRMLALHEELTSRVSELEEVLVRVRQLQGLLPICSWCKRVRVDHNYWQQVESYLSRLAAVEFSHGICPDCLDLELTRLRQ